MLNSLFELISNLVFVNINIVSFTLHLVFITLWITSLFYWVFYLIYTSTLPILFEPLTITYLVSFTTTLLTTLFKDKNLYLSTMDLSYISTFDDLITFITISQNDEEKLHFKYIIVILYIHSIFFLFIYDTIYFGIMYPFFEYIIDYTELLNSILSNIFITLLFFLCCFILNIFFFIISNIFSIVSTLITNILIVLFILNHSLFLVCINSYLIYLFLFMLPLDIFNLIVISIRYHIIRRLTIFLLKTKLYFITKLNNTKKLTGFILYYFLYYNYNIFWTDLIPIFSKIFYNLNKKIKNIKIDKLIIRYILIINIYILLLIYFIKSIISLKTFLLLFISLFNWYIFFYYFLIYYWVQTYILFFLIWFFLFLISIKKKIKFLFVTVLTFSISHSQKIFNKKFISYILLLHLNFFLLHFYTLYIILNFYVFFLFFFYYINLLNSEILLKQLKYKYQNDKN